MTRREPLKILVLAHDSGLYGAQISLLDMIRYLDRTRFSLLVAVPSVGPFTSALDGLGVPYLAGWVKRWIHPPRTIPIAGALLKPWRLVRLRWHPYLQTLLCLLGLPVRVLLLALLVKLKGIDMVYTNTITLLEGALVGKLCGIPHVWHLREAASGNEDLDNPFPTEWLKSMIIRCSSDVITNSRALRDQIFGLQPPARLHVVHNGVDLRSFATAQASGRPAGLPERGRLVAICGAIQERKDVLTFLRAAASVSPSHPDVHFVIIGKKQGPYYQLVEQEIALRRLEPVVHCIGYREDIPEVFAHIDILVSAARSEPFGRTIIEAMAAGKPVVSTRSGGPEEIIEDGVNGFLVEVADDAALALKLDVLLSDTRKMQEMGEHARSSVEHRFNLVDCVSRIEAIFEQVQMKHD